MENIQLNIAYKNKHHIANLILGIIWILLGLTDFIVDEEIDWNTYFWIGFGLLYLVIYFYQKIEKYISIENGFIKQNWPFGKCLQLSEIKRIRHFAGDFTLKTTNKTLKIKVTIYNFTPN